MDDREVCREDTAKYSNTAATAAAFMPALTLAAVLVSAGMLGVDSPVTLSLSGALAVFGGAVYYRSVRGAQDDLMRLELRLADTRREYEHQIMERTSELMNAGEEQLQDFAQSVKELERRLTDRTVQLEAANKELESFAYSVSHDLRAPLERIAGFVKALSEDYEDRIDPEGQDYLRRVRDGTAEMGKLIDAILHLSRLTRGRMRHEPVNLSQLATAIAADLARAEPGREVKVDILPGLTANGDQELLKAALSNLFGNAWKFTGKQPAPHVEFGALAPSEATLAGQEGKTVYFLRDNGAGFDMTYAEKLFTPFQRLHRESDYSGTGIGLATVQRIIHRHGGEIWAEGEVGRGSTFYFTLERVGGTSGALAEGEMTSWQGGAP